MPKRGIGVMLSDPRPAGAVAAAAGVGTIASVGLAASLLKRKAPFKSK
ncbi:MAG: hypothetical protein Q4D58_01000 [Synergistaceae bacterium]|nr:hypothetical protein [Synergistaceae bacterium]